MADTILPENEYFFVAGNEEEEMAPLRKDLGFEKSNLIVPGGLRKSSLSQQHGDNSEGGEPNHDKSLRAGLSEQVEGEPGTSEDETIKTFDFEDEETEFSADNKTPPYHIPEKEMSNGVASNSDGDDHSGGSASE